jgi:hypothetical protein
MCEKVVGDAWKPAGAERIEPGLLDGVEQLGRLTLVWLMTLMNGGIVKPTLEHDAIRHRTEAAVRGGVRLRQQRIRILYAHERPRAGRDSPDGLHDTPRHRGTENNGSISSVSRCLGVTCSVFSI